eukprot:1579130-Alexandrium_andersonii.AAC.1
MLVPPPVARAMLLYRRVRDPWRAWVFQANGRVRGCRGRASASCRLGRGPRGLLRMGAGRLMERLVRGCRVRASASCRLAWGPRRLLRKGVGRLTEQLTSLGQEVDQEM